MITGDVEVEVFLNCLVKYELINSGSINGNKQSTDDIHGYVFRQFQICEVHRNLFASIETKGGFCEYIELGLDSLKWERKIGPGIQDGRYFHFSEEYQKIYNISGH